MRSWEKFPCFASPPRNPEARFCLKQETNEKFHIAVYTVVTILWKSRHESESWSWLASCSSSGWTTSVKLGFFYCSTEIHCTLLLVSHEPLLVVTVLITTILGPTRRWRPTYNMWIEKVGCPRKVSGTDRVFGEAPHAYVYFLQDTARALRSPSYACPRTNDRAWLNGSLVVSVVDVLLSEMPRPFVFLGGYWSNTSRYARIFVCRAKVAPSPIHRSLRRKIS